MVRLEPCVTLAYLEPCHTEKPAILRILAYFRHEACSELCQTSKMEEAS